MLPAVETILAGAARALLLGHAAAAIVLIGASTHQSLAAIAALRGAPRPRGIRAYGATTAIAYLVCFVFGLVVYPTFRVEVRGLWLDRHAVWASNLFDMKENLAALGLPLVAGAWLLGRKLEEDRVVTYAACVFLTTAIVWFDVISGLLITMARSV
jgi:hypothetical protein